MATRKKLTKQYGASPAAFDLHPRRATSGISCFRIRTRRLPDARFAAFVLICPPTRQQGGSDRINVVIGNIFRFGAAHGNQHRGVPQTEWAARRDMLAGRPGRCQHVRPGKQGWGFVGYSIFRNCTILPGLPAYCRITPIAVSIMSSSGARSRSIGRLRPARIVTPITPRALISRRASRNQRGRQLRRKT